LYVFVFALHLVDVALNFLSAQKNILLLNFSRDDYPKDFFEHVAFNPVRI
jgi:hypothetical protein